MDRLEAPRVLSKSLWLSHEPPDIRAAIAAHASLREVRAGARVYDEASGPAGLVAIARGHLRLDIAAGPDDPALFAIATAGFVLSDFPIPPGLARPVTATAGVNSTLLVVSPAQLQRLAGRTPGLEPALTRLAILNLWTALSLVSMLRRQSTVERVAMLLVTLAGADLADGWLVETPQADLAAMAAIGRTTLIQALRALEAMRLISVGYRHIRLSNVAGLRALCDGDIPPARLPARAGEAIR